MTISIRKAEVEDVVEIHQMILELADFHHTRNWVKTNPEELMSAGFLTAPQFGVLLAEVEGSTAGYLSYTWNYSIWMGGEYMNLDDLYIRSAFRNRGLGEALMEQAKEVCLEKNVHRLRWEVDADNEGAIRFYERLGAHIKEKGVCHWKF